MDYSEFIASKSRDFKSIGIAPPDDLGVELFPFHGDLVRWALKRGRAAIFANTGLGKTRMQLAWARSVMESGDERPALILAPLAVARQTAEEASRLGVAVNICRDVDDVDFNVINITNYERIQKFDTRAFGAVVLDESSCIKHHDAKTLGQLLEAFRDTPFKLCATATPAPNDWTELGNHAEFLGVCSRVEMLSEFFCHDGGETQVWRLKGHARGAFWRWVASWGALVSHPRDLGYEADQYDLPPLTVHEHIIASQSEDHLAMGMLFQQEAQTLSDRRRARKTSMNGRVSECAAIVNESSEPWVVWCDLNAESQALTASIDGALEITGSMPIEEKERRLIEFQDGRARVLVSKPSICGFGLNWQHCARQAFVGVTDSWESYYQAVRRSWRFGQSRPVHVHIFASESEGAVVANLKRKDADAQEMARSLARETAESVRSEVRGLVRETNDYLPECPMVIPSWMKSEDAA